MLTTKSDQAVHAIVLWGRAALVPPRTSRELAFAKIRARVEGTRLAAEKLTAR
jgi:hypothetical protein